MKNIKAIFVLLLFLNSTAFVKAQSATVLANAQSYFFPWTPKTNNLCPNGDACGATTSAKFTANVPVDAMAYKYGGFDNPSTFISKLPNHKAGDIVYKANGVACATGVDCIGYVSRCFGYTSWVGLSGFIAALDIKSVTDYATLEPGDVLYFYINGSSKNHIMIVQTNNTATKRFSVYQAGGIAGKPKTEKVNVGGYTYAELKAYGFKGGRRANMASLKSAQDTNDETLIAIDENAGITANDKILLLYPNPVKNSLTISMDGVTTGTIINIYNSTGEQVKSIEATQTSALEIQVGDLPSGFYFVTASRNNNKAVGKFVKE